MSSEWYGDPDLVLGALRQVERGDGRRRAPEIAGYADLAELARGGQGVVYTALQESTGRRVAIKLLGTHADDDPLARRRFEREIDMVARLRHPNIVRLYDSGVTADGRLYCVMDFIEGVPLDEHLEQHDAAQGGGHGGRGAERGLVELLHAVTTAVSHAHQRGVIHRDLKPSNIRVDAEGRPHVLDFGLAKVVDPQERASLTVTRQVGGFAGSLPWASPEQVGGDPSDIDTRTDVYSIGVMLHHAVTGSFPYDVQGPVREVLNAIVEREPTPPPVRPPGGRKGPRDGHPQVSPEGQGTALPGRRAAGGGPAADPRRRNRCWPSPTAAGTRSAALCGATAWRSRWRRPPSWRSSCSPRRCPCSTAGPCKPNSGPRRRAGARQRSTTSSSRMLASADPGNLGRDVTVREMIARTREDLDADVSLPPLVRASLLAVIGRTSSSLGHFDAALDSARHAKVIAEEELGERNATTIEYRGLELSVLISLSRYEEAEGLVEGLLADARAVLGEEAPATLSAASNLALVYSEAGAFDEAIAIHRRTWETRTRLFGASDPAAITSLHHLAIDESWAGHLDRAREHYELAASLVESGRGEDHPDAIRIRSGLAVTLEKLGEDASSEAMLRELLPRAERVFGEHHRDTNIVKSNLAFGLAKVGRHAESLELMREVYASTLETMGERHTDTINAMGGVAGALHRLGEYEEALLLLEDAHSLSLEVFGPRHVRTLDSGTNLAQALRKVGRLAEASDVALKSLARARAYYSGEPHADLAWFTKVAGEILVERGKLDEAITLLEESGELAALGRDRGHLPNTLESLARAYRAAGRDADADRTLEERRRAME